MPTTDGLPVALSRRGRAQWWRRAGTPKSGFRLTDAKGTAVRDAPARERLGHLVIPPAWRDVRINPSPNGRIQVVGLDEAGRVQYLYNHSFEARRQRDKYERVEHFGEYLPQIRRVTAVHLQLPGLSKERVLAVVVRLMNELHFRVGSDKHTRRNHTFGVTTLQNRHLRFTHDGALVFSFPGKHHVPTRRVLLDGALARVLWELKAIRGSRLFKYVGNDGRIHPVRDRDVNAYLKVLTSSAFSAKDFRTWAGTLHVAKELALAGPAKNKTDAKGKIAQAVRNTARQLNNTPAVCRSAYLHPAVLKAYLAGVTVDAFAGAPQPIGSLHEGYLSHELALLELFQRARTRTLRRARNVAPAAAAAHGHHVPPEEASALAQFSPT